MANLLKPRSATHNTSYEGFDLSHSINFTSSVGHIIPIMYDLLLPDDKVTLKNDFFTRMMPLLSASPVTIREHVDFYFVPLECLFSLFPSLLSDTNEDLYSSLVLPDMRKDVVPKFNIYGYFNQEAYERTDLIAVKDYWGFDYRFKNLCRLFDALNYGYSGKFEPFVFNNGDTDEDSVFVNTLIPSAYQAIYQYFFRDDSREQFSNGFNLDAFAGLQNNNYTSPRAHVYLDSVFQMRYRPLKKDPYTITTPSPLGGQTSPNHFSIQSEDKNFASFIKQWLSDTDNIGITSNYEQGVTNTNGDYPATSDKDYYTDVSFPNRTNASTVQQSLQQHRIAQAIEKLSAIWLQSGKSYKEVMQNLFGMKNVQEDWSKPIYIGSNSAQINISEVVADVTTGSGVGDDFNSYSEAGEVTGRGVSFDNSNREIKFHARCHGILLALYSAVPDVIYRHYGIDTFHNYGKRSDFPNPLTDELGEQPLFDYEVLSSKDIVPSQPRILGWRPYHSELKLKCNTAFGSFKGTLAYWLPSESFNFDVVKGFYCNPAMLDPILLNSYMRTLNNTDIAEMKSKKVDLFEDDPLLHFFKMHYKKASRQSSYGVPKSYFG